MSRIRKLFITFALFGIALHVEGKHISDGLRPEENGTEIQNEQTTEAQENVTEAEEEEKEVCFNVFGCFSMAKPWKSILRPIPAPMDPEKIPVRLLFYSQPNIYEEFVVTTYPTIDFGEAPFDPNKPTAIITHGFSNNGSAQWLHDTKDAYLGKIDANVMITDWGAGAQMWNYLQVAANTRVVGKAVAKALQELIDNRGLDPKKVHLIGHSLGAQISSYIAKQVPGIARLTALDPAQPGFEGFDKIVRLDKSDAEFVDVIHTDAKPFIPTLGFGMLKPHGHVDFYMNGGFEQPGCIIPPKEKLPEVKSLLDLAKYPVEFISQIKTCNHGRAYQYLIEAFNETDSCIFWGHRASLKNVAKSVTQTLTQGLLSNYVALSSTCTKENCVPLGFATKKSPLRGVFVVTTANRSPYCIPEPGVPPEDPNEEDKTKKPGTLLGNLLSGTGDKISDGLKSVSRLF